MKGDRKDKSGRVIKTDISQVLKGKQSLTDFWLDSHWAGKDKDRAARRESFDRDYERFKDLNK